MKRKIMRYNNTSCNLKIMQGMNLDRNMLILIPDLSLRNKTGIRYFNFILFEYVLFPILPVILMYVDCTA